MEGYLGGRGSPAGQGHQGLLLRHPADWPVLAGVLGWPRGYPSQLVHLRILRPGSAWGRAGSLVGMGTVKPTAKARRNHRLPVAAGWGVRPLGAASLARGGAPSGGRLWCCRGHLGGRRSTLSRPDPWPPRLDTAATPICFGSCSGPGGDDVAEPGCPLRGAVLGVQGPAALGGPLPCPAVVGRAGRPPPSVAGVPAARHPDPPGGWDWPLSPGGHPRAGAAGDQTAARRVSVL